MRFDVLTLHASRDETVQEVHATARRRVLMSLLKGGPHPSGVATKGLDKLEIPIFNSSGDQSTCLSIIFDPFVGTILR